MDLIFGLPCINESRAMDNARNRNFIADKILAQKCESFDRAKSSVSEKFLTSRCYVKDFRDTIDFSLGKTSPRLHPGRHEKKPTPGSMTLEEFDRIRNETTRNRKHINLAPTVHQMTLSAKESNPNSVILRKENTQVLNTFDTKSNHIVDLEQHERCLPINRQKHAMRNAWERATTADMHYKRQRSRAQSQSPQSSTSTATSSKAHDKLYHHQSTGQNRHNNMFDVKQSASGDRKKKK